MFEKLDKIVVDEKDLAKIDKYIRGLEEKGDFQTPLEEGVLIVNYDLDDVVSGLELKGRFTEATQFSFDKEDGSITLDYYVSNPKSIKRELEFTISGKAYERDGSIKFDIIKSSFKNVKQIKEEETLMRCLMAVMDTLYYMSDFKRNEIIEIEEDRKIQKKVGNGKGGSKTKYRTVKFTTKKYVFSKSKIPNNSKRFKRVFQWTVRGHWRHYRGGKVVWVKPHVKGDKDAERIEKDYKL